MCDDGQLICNTNHTFFILKVFIMKRTSARNNPRSESRDRDRTRGAYEWDRPQNSRYESDEDDMDDNDDRGFFDDDDIDVGSQRYSRGYEDSGHRNRGRERRGFGN